MRCLRSSRRGLLLSVALWLSGSVPALWPTVDAQAQAAAIKDPWVRTTVPRQKSTAVYMEITAARAGRLIEVSSPIAGVVEIHEMRMDRDMMRMRAIAALDLPAGVPVSLKPGGYHIMLMDLRSHIRSGDKVPLSLVVELRDGRRETLQIQATARSASTAPGEDDAAGAHSGHGAGAASHGGGGAAGAGGHSAGGHRH